MIRHEERDGVAVLRMEFGSANALGEDSVEALNAAVRALTGPTVITGEGGVFSAGLNLVELDRLDEDAMGDFLERFTVLMTRVLTCRHPLVAAVNGHAVAGGCVLAMACDHRVGIEGAYNIGMNELAIGLTLPAAITEILRGKLSAEHAGTVILGGALYPPSEAVRVGLLNEVVADVDSAIGRACALAADLGRSPAEFASMKGSLVAPITERLQRTREPLDGRFLRSWFGDAARATRTRMLEKLGKR